jgi:hypothetical protein
MNGLATAVVRVLGAGLPRESVEARIGEADELARACERASGRPVPAFARWRVAAENVVLDQCGRLRRPVRRRAEPPAPG